jgi:hypothetical protein
VVVVVVVVVMIAMMITMFTKQCPLSKVTQTSNCSAKVLCGCGDCSKY